MSIKRISEINKTRTKKDTYKDWEDVQLKEGTIRVGEEFVQELIKRSTYYYASKCDKDWEKSDFIDAQNFTHMLLEMDDGAYDPRFLNIVEAEREFDITFKEDWAKYKYEINGEVIEGYYGLKGTMDLIVQEDEDTYIIHDYKTGQRKNWATGEIKDFEALQKDKQLMLYYMVAKQLYPGKNIYVNILFVRDGGPYTIFFDDSHIEKMKDILKEHFKQVQINDLPSLLDPNHNDFRCKILCDFHKNKWPGTNKSMCDFLHEKIREKGTKKVIEEYKSEGFSFNKYSAPGT